MRRIFITGFCAMLFMASACNQPAANQSTENLTDTAAQANAALPDKDNVSQILTSYISLKNELVKSDAAAGKKAAANLEDELIEVKGCAEAATMARMIAASDNIEEQRKAFLTLSKDIIPLAKGMKQDKPMYVAFCPMANDGKGGFWLSEFEDIKNPYYGDAMLECGEVKEVLSK
ncbi:MAG: DUF3347 domain-containing protein [Sphingobacteriaceae bacterium]|nr:MAG: DUF3347 domain-containing protein [Sphingobacteriaceae bacterium]